MMLAHCYFTHGSVFWNKCISLIWLKSAANTSHGWVVLRRDDGHEEAEDLHNVDLCLILSL